MSEEIDRLILEALVDRVPSPPSNKVGPLIALRATVPPSPLVKDGFIMSTTVFANFSSSHAFYFLTEEGMDRCAELLPEARDLRNL